MSSNSTHCNCCGSQKPNKLKKAIFCVLGGSFNFGPKMMTATGNRRACKRPSNDSACYRGRAEISRFISDQGMCLGYDAEEVVANYVLAWLKLEGSPILGILENQEGFDLSKLPVALRQDLEKTIEIQIQQLVPTVGA
ncbi:hypothetical protein F5Y19DRAFT_479511 [Xylariaceae sp. FL1651]|nr:hypothetical protein F5Y19DRAFT_479511 [Xylariaceae sp. FL1651]